MKDKYLLEAEIITPVHVGAGQEKKLIENLDFVLKDKKLILIDTARLFGALNENDKSRFIKNLADGSLNDINSYLARKDISNAGNFKLAEIDCPGSNPMQEVLPLISTAGPEGRSVYLPGSSIKGAVRSVLYAYFIKEGMGKNEKDIFGSIDRNLMSFIQIGDAPFASSRIINSKIFNLHLEAGEWTAGWKHDRYHTDDNFSVKGFVTSYEVFRTRAKSSFTLKINRNRLEFIKSSQKYREERSFLPPNHDFFMTMEITGLFKIINWHTRRYLEAEKNFFLKDENQESYCEDITAGIDNLIKNVPEDNKSCILHLGCGSGYHGITGDWQYSGKHDETGFHNGKINFKSRKMSFRKIKGHTGFDFMPMGFIKLTVKE
jgi:CRISPR/Cas system CSM-associated protein Csm5 (group 7 of RAMP superfamily)